MLTSILAAALCVFVARANGQSSASSSQAAAAATTVPALADTKCARIFQQATVYDKKLYVDGGGFNELRTNGAIGPNNLTYILDLSRSFNLSEPPYTTISKLDKSAYSAGALFPSQDGQLYQFAGVRQVYIYKETLSGATKTWYDNEVAQGEKGNIFRLWDFDVDSNEWHQGVELDGGVPQRVWRGASAMMPKRGVGYYLGGLQVGEDGFFDSESGLLYDRLTKYEVGRNFSTDVGPDASGLGRWDGAMVAIEEIGKKGILVALGGNRATYATTSAPRTLLDFKTVSVYDVATGQWFEQETSGADTPDAKPEFCSVSAVAADNSSAQIYIFGGSDLSTEDSGVDVHVLTLPYFRWIRVPFDKVPGGFRRDHACTTYGGRQMLIIGGRPGISTPTASYAADYITPGTSSDTPIEGTNCVKGGMSIKAFDMSTLKFQDIWNPSLVDYEVPQAVIDIIGGDKQGNANVTKPQVGWTNDGLASVFASQSTLGDSTTSSTPESKSKPNSGTIAGGVVGGLAAVALGVCAFLFYRRRKHKMSADGYQIQSASKASTVYEKHELGSYSLEPVEAYGYPIAKANHSDEETGIAELEGGPASSELPGAGNLPRNP